MPFELQMTPLGKSEPERLFQTNDEILAAWRRHELNRLQPVTRSHYDYEIQQFLDAWQSSLVTKLHPRDIREYVRNHSTRCQFYRRHGFPTRGPSCVNRQDLTKCGAGTCPMYNPILASTTEKHYQALSRLYDFLTQEEQVPNNFVRDLKRAWKGENRHRFRPTQRYVPNTEQVARLINGTQAMNHKIVYAILAKTGIRVGELQRLQVDTQHMNLEQGWMKVPEYGGKRRGNRFLIIDPELRPIIRAYLRWRDGIVRKDERGKDETNRLLVTTRGTGYRPETETSIVVHMFRPDTARLGIGDHSAGRGCRLRPHGLRHYFSNEIKRKGIDPYWWNVLRGDLPPGNEKTYVHPDLEQIKTNYALYAPRLNLH